MKIKKCIFFLICITAVLSVFSGCDDIISGEPYMQAAQKKTYNIGGKTITAFELFREVADDVEWTTENLAEGKLVIAELTIKDNGTNTVSFCYRVDDDKSVNLIMVGLNDMTYMDDANINAALNAIFKRYENAY